MHSTDILRPLSDDLEFDALRFPGEDVLREQVSRRPAAVEIVRRWCSLEQCPIVPWGVHREAFVASPAAAPALAQLGRMLVTILGLEARPELVVFPSPEFFIAADAANTCRVVVSSAVIQRVGVREALFQVGRRLAWQLLGHVPLLGDPTAGMAKPDHDSLLVRGLWKFQELTCDRVGLLCCQDAELAARSIVRFASGLPDELLDIDWEALLAERIPEEEAMLADSPYQFALLRAAALRQFASEDRYEECFVSRFKAIAPSADPPTSLPLEPETHEPLVIDAAIIEPPPTEVIDAEMIDFDVPNHAAAAELSMTTRMVELASEPDVAVLEEPLMPAPKAVAASLSIDAAPSNEPESAIREFTLWGVLWVIGIDQPVPESARAELWEYFGSEVAAAIDEAENPDGDERCARKCAAAAPLVARANLERRRAVIEDLIHLGQAAGPIRCRERERVADLAELLELSLDEVDEAAAHVVEPEFTDFAFAEGQDVEAKFDDGWTPGVVHSIEPDGGVRVYFPGLAETRWMSPLTDALRPLEPSPTGG